MTAGLPVSRSRPETVRRIEHRLAEAFPDLAGVREIEVSLSGSHCRITGRGEHAGRPIAWSAVGGGLEDTLEELVRHLERALAA